MIMSPYTPPVALVCVASSMIGNAIPAHANKMLRMVSDLVTSGGGRGAGGGTTTVDNNNNDVELRVIGAGLGRTGTTSLKSALEILGYRPYDMVDNVARGHSNLWTAALRSQERRDGYHAYYDHNAGDDGSSSTSIEDEEGGEERRRNNAMRDVIAALSSAGYDATVDDPAADLSIELLRAYPEAKVILTTRADPGRWYESVQLLNAFVSSILASPFYFVARDNIEPVEKLADAIHGHGRRKCFDEDLGWGHFLPFMRRGSPADKGACLEYYRNHNRMIRELVPAAQLLDYSVRDGWGPLCAFLDEPVPEGVPFPHVNGGSSVRVAMAVILLATAVLYGLMMYLIVALPVRWHRKRRRRRNPSKRE